jgi:glycosyltransferase involved in cell wall biosynthesis
MTIPAVPADRERRRSHERCAGFQLRALIVTSNFPPDASVGTMRSLRLVRHLSDAGWHVDVLTAAPEGFRRGTVVDAALLERVPSTVRVLRARAMRPLERLGALVRFRRKPSLPVLTGTSGAAAGASPGRLSRLKRAASSCLALPDREISWMLPAIAQGWRAARESSPDVIYSSGPPFTAHLVGAALARVTGRPWAADFRDPWARAPWREYAIAAERLAWRACERLVVRRADALVFVTDTNRREFAGHYGPDVESRSHLVPNGCDPAEFGADVPPPSGDRRRPFVLLHAGSLYGARNPVALLEAVAAMIRDGSLDRNQFRLRFVGRIGVPGMDLPALAGKLDIEDVVEFVPHMPRRDVLREMQAASALLIVQPITTVSIPAKLYEYMAAGRPVLALAEPGGETAELVARSGAGRAVPAGEVTAIRQALEWHLRREEPFVPVDPAYFDGAARAEDTCRILLGLAARAGRISPS